MTAQGRSYSWADYTALDRVNFSRLKWMQYSPAHYRANPPRESKSMDEGRLIHTCLLEPQVFERTTAVWRGGEKADGTISMSKSTNAYKAFKANCASNGIQPITDFEFNLAHKVANAVMGHPVAGRYFTGGQAETSVEWKHPFGIECKSRIDYLGQDHIADLKTTVDLRPDKFNRSVLRYGYHAQAAFYQDAVRELTGEKVPFFIVAVEKVRPYDVAVYELDDMVLDLGRQTYTGWMERLLECQAKDEWPGMFDQVTKVELPNWAYEMFEDATLYVDGVAV